MMVMVVGGSRGCDCNGCWPKKTWNALPEGVASFQSEYAFPCQLKTWLFKKSFPDIII